MMEDRTREHLAELKAAKIAPLEGERWAVAPDVPAYLVSTEGRAFRREMLVVQPTGYGKRTCNRILPGRLVDSEARHPRLTIEDRGTYKARVDLARQVLGAFVRPGRPNELAERKNGVAWDCRLANLIWSTDRRADLLERFLAGADSCHDTADLEHAAIRLGVGHTVLGKVLTEARRRVGFRAKPGPKSPAEVAREIVDARVKWNARPGPSRASGVAEAAAHT